jgi:hypothetical protein
MGGAQLLAAAVAAAAELPWQQPGRGLPMFSGGWQPACSGYGWQLLVPGSQGERGESEKQVKSGKSKNKSKKKVKKQVKSKINQNIGYISP